VVKAHKGRIRYSWKLWLGCLHSLGSLLLNFCWRHGYWRNSENKRNYGYRRNL